MGALHKIPQMSFIILQVKDKLLNSKDLTKNLNKLKILKKNKI